MKHYFKLPAEQSAAIHADLKAVEESNFALLTDLAGVPITEFHRSGNLAFALAHLESIQTVTPPTQPGWELQKGYQDRYAPSNRTKAGKIIAAQIEDLDLLGIFSALQRAGVSPYWMQGGMQRGGVAEVTLGAPEILLIWDSRWGTRTWPEWVQEIRGSEWHAILEAVADPAELPPVTAAVQLDALLAEVVADVRAERLAQTTREGYTPEHDDAHTNGALSQAAAAYAYVGPDGQTNRLGQAVALWPWDAAYWKPGHYRHNLIRSCALNMAELERLERLADTVSYWSVGSDESEIYAATSRESLVEHLRTEGSLPDDMDEIKPVPQTTQGSLDEAGTVKATLREIAIDVLGTDSYTLPFQIQSAYNL